MLLGGLSLLLAGVFTVRLWTMPATEFDDAFMFLRYAMNLLAGYGFEWNAGEGSVFGPTSLLYTFWVTLIHGVVSDGASALRLASSIPVYLLAVVYAAMFRRVSRWSWPACLALASSYVFVLDPYYLVHGANGMDTALAQCCAALLVFFSVFAPFRLRWVVAVAYLTFLARPDLGLYATVLPVGALWAREGLRPAIRLGCTMTGVLLLDTLLKWWWLGDVLPLSFFAKRRGYYEGFMGLLNWDTTAYLFHFLLHGAPFAILAFVLLQRRHLKLVAAVGVPLLATLAYHLQVVAIMGDDARYLWPQMPFFVGLGVLAWRNLDRRQIGLLVRQRVLGVLAYGALLGLVLIWGPQFYRQVIVGSMTRYQAQSHYQATAKQGPRPAGWRAVLHGMADWTETLPTGTVMAATEYGMLAARRADVVIVDMAGLHDAYLAHQGFDADYVLDRRRPDLIWMPRVNYTFMWAKLLDHPSFKRDYDFYPGLMDYGIAIRRGSERSEQLRLDLGRWAKDLHHIEDLSLYLAVPGSRYPN